MDVQGVAITDPQTAMFSVGAWYVPVMALIVMTPEEFSQYSTGTHVRVTAVFEEG
jgi:hypothetical protein